MKPVEEYFPITLLVILLLFLVLALVAGSGEETTTNVEVPTTPEIANTTEYTEFGDEVPVYLLETVPLSEEFKR